MGRKVFHKIRPKVMRVKNWTDSSDCRDMSLAKPKYAVGSYPPPSLSLHLSIFSAKLKRMPIEYTFTYNQNTLILTADILV